jgi:hypothetical protein
MPISRIPLQDGALAWRLQIPQHARTGAWMDHGWGRCERGAWLWPKPGQCVAPLLMQRLQKRRAIEGMLGHWVAMNCHDLHEPVMTH